MELPPLWMLLLVSSGFCELSRQPVAVARGEVVVRFDRSFRARDRGERDREVVGAGLHGQPGSVAERPKVVGPLDGFRVDQKRVDLSGDVPFEATPNFPR